VWHNLVIIDSLDDLTDLNDSQILDISIPSALSHLTNACNSFKLGLVTNLDVSTECPLCDSLDLRGVRIHLLLISAAKHSSATCAEKEESGKFHCYFVKRSKCLFTSI